MACPAVSSAGLLCGRIEAGFCLRAELIDKFYSSLQGRVLSGRKMSKKTLCECGIVLRYLWQGVRLLHLGAVQHMFCKTDGLLNIG